MWVGCVHLGYVGVSIEGMGGDFLCRLGVEVGVGEKPNAACGVWRIQNPTRQRKKRSNHDSALSGVYYLLYSYCFFLFIRPVLFLFGSCLFYSILCPDELLSF